MITIPILLNFDNDKVIGSLTVDETQLPTIPNYTFAIGYRYITEDSHELICTSVVLDKNYQAYLDKQMFI